MDFPKVTSELPDLPVPLYYLHPSADSAGVDPLCARTQRSCWLLELVLIIYMSSRIWLLYKTILHKTHMEEEGPRSVICFEILTFSVLLPRGGPFGCHLLGKALKT